MSDDRLPTALYVEGHLRRLAAEGVYYYILQKGAYASGTIMLKLNGLENGCVLLQQQRDLDGKMGWLTLSKGDNPAESDIDATIRRAMDRDPDLWVLEIEDRRKQNPFDGKVF